MLHHGLAGAEGAGHRGHAALGQGEQGVDDPLPGGQQNIGGQLALIRTAHPHRPGLHQAHRHLAAVHRRDRRHRVLHGEIALRNGLDGTDNAVGHHDLVRDHSGLLHSAQDVPGPHLVPDGLFRHEMPALGPVKGGYVNAPFEIGAGQAHNLLKRALNPVENRADEPRPQLHAQGNTGGRHRLSRAQAGGFLVNLYRSAVAVHLDDLPDQALLADPHHVEHIGLPHALGNNQRAGHLGDCPRCHPVIQPFPQSCRPA